MLRYLIIGRAFSTLKAKILEAGHEYTLLQDSAVTKYPDKKLKNRVVSDFSSKESILEAVRNLPHKYDAVIATYENYVLPAAWIAEELGLPGMPIKAAEACTDKYLMRSLFNSSEEKISPHFAEITTLEEALRFAKNYSYPLIIKPANLAKSLLVTKSSSDEELASNFNRTIEQIDKVYAKYAPSRKPKIIIVEFMEGTIHSVDAFVDAEGEPQVLHEVVDYRTGYDIGYEDNFHYSRLLPSKLPKKDQDKLRHVAALGIKCLGMQSSPAHVEIIMTKDGPQIVEIGARNGGYRERMHELANGIDITGAALSVALGKAPDIRSTRNEPCAVLELFPKLPGIFKGIRDEAKLNDLPSINYLSIKAKPGDFVGKSSDGYKMCAVIVLHNADANQFGSDLAIIDSFDWIETEPYSTDNQS